MSTRASPVKEREHHRTPIAKEDIENLSAVTLAALGMATTTTTSTSISTPQAAITTKRVSKMSNHSNEIYSTPPSTAIKSRTVSSSSQLSSNNNNNNSSITRTRDRTATASSIATSSDSHGHNSTPLTAIRRPAPQIHSSNNTTTTPRNASGSALKSGIKASPSSALKLSTNGQPVRTRKASNPPVSSTTSSHTPSAAIRSRASSSEASRIALAKEEAKEAKDKEELGQEKGIYVTQEEYSSLVALLSAKDDQISSLKDQVDEGKKELSSVKERNAKLQKERDSLLLEKKELLKNAISSSSSKEGSNSPNNTVEEGTISRREFESFKKQYEMQENLLEGFQRENEKATVELEALKKREKHLTEQLKKIYGPTFSADSEMNPLTPEHGGGGLSKRYPGTFVNGHGTSSPLGNGRMLGEGPSQQRRRSGFGTVPSSLMNTTSPLSLDSVLNEENGFSIEEEEGGETEGKVQKHNLLMDVKPAVLMDQLMSVQSLLERFEKRLLVRESELIKKEKEANEQMEKLQAIVVV